MARQSNAPTVREDAAKPAANIEAAQAEAAERSALVLKQYGDGLPFDLPRYEHVIRTHLSRSADEMLAAGRALLVVREHVPHGEWQEVLDRLGLEKGVAARMAKAALKFSGANVPTSAHLIEAAGNKSKLFELLTLDDEEIKELNDGGTVAGLTLDKVQTLSVSELRKELREHQAEKDASNKLLEDKNAQIDRLTKDLAAAKRRMKSEPPEEHIVKLRQEFVAEVTAVENTIRQALRDGIEKLRQAGMESGQVDLSQDNYAASALGMIRRAVDDLQAEFGLPELSGDDTPAYLKD